MQYKIQKVQNSCLRYCYNVKKYDHITLYLKLANWLTMENRRLHHSLVTVFRIIADSHFPNYLSNPINNLTVQHGYSTRSVALPTPTFSRSIKEKSFYVNFVSHFNQLPDYIKHSQSVLSFKNKLKLFLLEKQFSSI